MSEQRRLAGCQVPVMAVPKMPLLGSCQASSDGHQGITGTLIAACLAHARLLLAWLVTGSRLVSVSRASVMAHRGTAVTLSNGTDTAGLGSGRRTVTVARAGLASWRWVFDSPSAFYSLSLSLSLSPPLAHGSRLAQFSVTLIDSDNTV